VIASDPSWNLMLVLPLAVRTVMLIVRSFRENGKSALARSVSPQRVGGSGISNCSPTTPVSSRCEDALLII
jgi:hypothetical protein